MIQNDAKKIGIKEKVSPNDLRMVGKEAFKREAMRMLYDKTDEKTGMKNNGSKNTECTKKKLWRKIMQKR